MTGLKMMALVIRKKTLSSNTEKYKYKILYIKVELVEKVTLIECIKIQIWQLKYMWNIFSLKKTRGVKVHISYNIMHQRF